MFQRIKNYLDSIEYKNIISLVLVLLFLASVVAIASNSRDRWDDAKYASISRNSPLVKELLKEHPDAKYTVEEAEFYQEMYPVYTRYEHLWDPSTGTRWVIYWWTEDTAHRYHHPDVAVIIWPYNNEIIHDTTISHNAKAAFREPSWSINDWIVNNIPIIFFFAIVFTGIFLIKGTRDALLKGLRIVHRSKFETIMFLGALTLAAFILTVITCIVTHTNEDAFYTSILSDETQFAVRLSLWTSMISTLLIFMVALPAAYVSARHDFYGKSLIDTLLDLPLALPTIVGGAGLIMLFNTTSIGVFLSDNGIKLTFTPMGIIAAQFFVNVPFMVRPFKSTFMSISPGYEHIARTLGCSRSKTFFRVLLPMARNGMLGGIAITWARCIGEFGAVLMFAGATRFKTEVLPISVFLNMSTGEMELAISAAVILIAISATMLFIFEKIGEKGAFL